MKKQFLIYIFALSTTIASAQLYEIGVFAGGSNYIGDIGPTTYINPNQIAIGGVAKFNWTPRIAIRGTLTYTQLFATDSKSNNSFRENVQQRSFANNLLDGALGIEFSFFKYNLAKPSFTQTPYIIAQVGLNNYSIFDDNGKAKRKTNLIFPFGLGYKMKLAENIGITFESTFRYTFKDDIDGNNHTIPSQSFGNPNTNDWYVFTGISVVYAFGRPGCYSGSF